LEACGKIDNLTAARILISGRISGLQKQESDKDKSRTVAGSEFQTTAPKAAELRHAYSDNRERESRGGERWT